MPLSRRIIWRMSLIFSNDSKRNLRCSVEYRYAFYNTRKLLPHKPFLFSSINSIKNFFDFVKNFPATFQKNFSLNNHNRPARPLGFSRTSETRFLAHEAFFHVRLALNHSVSLKITLLFEQFTLTSPPFEETTIFPFIGSNFSAFSEVIVVT